MGKLIHLLWPVIGVFIRMVSRELWDKYEKKRRVRKIAKKLGIEEKDVGARRCPRNLPKNPY